MTRNLSGSIAITKLRHKMIEYQSKKTGETVKGIFIPVDQHDLNYLVPGKDDSYYLNVRVQVRDDADKYNQHGFIAHSVDSKTYRNASEEQREEFKKLNILGNLRDFERPANEGNIGNDTLEEVNEYPDDLPF